VSQFDVSDDLRDVEDNEEKLHGAVSLDFELGPLRTPAPTAEAAAEDG
jgi:hypothetical protein